MHTHTVADARTHTYIHTHTHIRRCTRTHIRSYIQTVADVRTHAHAHIHTLSYTSHVHRRTHPRSRSPDAGPAYPSTSRAKQIRGLEIAEEAIALSVAEAKARVYRNQFVVRKVATVRRKNREAQQSDDWRSGAGRYVSNMGVCSGIFSNLAYVTLLMRELCIFPETFSVLPRMQSCLLF